MFDVNLQSQSQSLLHKLYLIEKIYEDLPNRVGNISNQLWMCFPQPYSNPDYVPFGLRMDTLKRDVKVFNLCMGILHWTKREEFDKLDCSNSEEFILLEKELEKITSFTRNWSYYFNQPMPSYESMKVIKESINSIFKLHEKVIRERLAIIENSFLAYFKTVQ